MFLVRRESGGGDARFVLEGVTMAEPPEFALFNTPIGRCAIVWSAGGIIGVQLPEADDDKARARILRRHPDATEAHPPPCVYDAMTAILALLSGEHASLTQVQLDMAQVAPFDRQVYALARRIPPGETVTYGDIATQLGDKTLAREVGQAMGRNPFPIVVPCHRVVAANGRLGGFSARGGADTKLRMLAIEGAVVAGQPDLFA
jgi:methylated-DNA-[protein]-cysteine S-methyltransferase